MVAYWTLDEEKIHFDMNSNVNSGNEHMNVSIKLRQMPYPYRGMLAICSDLDETPDRSVYWEIMRFLNTTEKTAMRRAYEVYIKVICGNEGTTGLHDSDWYGIGR